MPNPTRDNFTVQFLSPDKQNKIAISVYDINGRKIEERVASTSEFISFGDDYPAGTYILKVRQGSENQQIKVVKMK